jgi:HAD superfamily hydrolase (TIGR01509 family)
VTCTAVVFDLDDTLAASGHVWREIWAGYRRRHGGGGDPSAVTALLGGGDWDHVLAGACGTRPGHAYDACTDEAIDALRAGRITLLEGAAEMVAAAAARVPVALASAAPQRYVTVAAEALGLREHLTAIVSDRDVARPKPAPDPFLLAAVRLGHVPGDCAAVEDSAAGIRAAHAAGMTVLAIPNRIHPPSAGVLALASHRARSAGEATGILTGIQTAAAFSACGKIAVITSVGHWPGRRDRRTTIPRLIFHHLAASQPTWSPAYTRAGHDIL